MSAASSTSARTPACSNREQTRTPLAQVPSQRQSALQRVPIGVPHGRRQVDAMAADKGTLQRLQIGVANAGQQLAATQSAGSSTTLAPYPTLVTPHRKRRS